MQPDAGALRARPAKAHMSRNPYHDTENRPLLGHSVLAYIDILGYGDLIATSERDGTKEELLQTLHKALSKIGNGLKVIRR